MGYGKGRWWHKFYNFPDFPRVTKTLTLVPILGSPFLVARIGKSVWNRVGLNNIGISKWIDEYKHYKKLDNIIVSLAGSDDDIEMMAEWVDILNIRGIELNFSCPNYMSFGNKKIPYSRHPVYLKLNYCQRAEDYDLDKVRGIRMNSMPAKYFGAWSGEKAQTVNWARVGLYNFLGINTAGCSFYDMKDIRMLEEWQGCKEIGIGSTILTNPRLVEGLKNET